MSDSLEDYKVDGLTNKQRMFCHEYIACNFNATRAAERAGYKGSEITLGTTGHENLKKPKIKKRIEALIQEQAKAADITAAGVLNNIADLAFNAEEDTHRLRGLELLGKYLKLFTDRSEISGINGMPIPVATIDKNTDPQKAADTYLDIMRGVQNK